MVDKDKVYRTVGMWDQMGKEKGTKGWLNFWPKYKGMTGPVFLLGAILLAVFGYYWEAAFCYGLMHVHIFLNQLWWQSENNQRAVYSMYEDLKSKFTILEVKLDELERQNRREKKSRKDEDLRSVISESEPKPKSS